MSENYEFCRDNWEINENNPILYKLARVVSIYDAYHSMYAISQ